MRRFNHTMIYFKVTDYYKIIDFHINDICLEHMLIVLLF